MSRLLRRLFAAAATAFTLCGPANAESVAYSVMAPVTITSVTVDETTLPTTNLDSPLISFVNGVTVKFVNTSDVTATSVTFLFKDDGGRGHSVVDRGIFSPGAQIKHELSVDGLSVFSVPSADVVEIDFADGSSWQKSGDLMRP